MVDCPLPTTGGTSVAMVLLAFLVLGIGVALVVVGRRRGVGGGAAVVVALALGATSLAVSDARTADAVSCPPSTTVASTAAPATTTTTTTTAATTTTTVAATTTTTPPTTTTTTSSTSSTTSTTSSTSSTTSSTTSTTIAPAPDLMPSIVGPTTAVPGVRGDYTLTIANVGSAPTSGPMTFTLAFTLVSGNSTLTAEALGSTDWTFVGSGGGNLNYVSNPGFTLAPGAVSTTSFGVTWSPQLPDTGSFTIATALPTGIGGETNAANNSASLTVVVTPPPPDLTPNIVGPTSGFSGTYVISITNTGGAPTAGPMTFTLALTVLDGPGPVLPATVNSADWTSVASPSGLTFTSNAGLVIAPGATSVVTLLLEWRVDAPGSWQGTVTLPTGIGGETNATNNSDSITVVIPPPPD